MPSRKVQKSRVITHVNQPQEGGTDVDVVGDAVGYEVGSSLEKKVKITLLLKMLNKSKILNRY